MQLLLHHCAFPLPRWFVGQVQGRIATHLTSITTTAREKRDRESVAQIYLQHNCAQRAQGQILVLSPIPQLLVRLQSLTQSSSSHNRK